ncbi:MAG: EI24 domain-containing protein [Pseudomonadota bacterium]
MILNAFFRALGQLGDPRFRRVLGIGILLTIVLLIAATAGVLWFVGWLTGDMTSLPLIGEVTWLSDLFSWGSVLLMMILSIFLMLPVASAITSFMLDDVAQAVEDKHYPNLPKVGRVPLSDALRDTLNFLGLLIGANLLALVLYVILPFASIFIFWAVNGFLLGREYFTLAAMRRVGRAEAKVLRKRHRALVWLAGVLMAIPLSVPILNLIVPIVGAATFTNLYHMLVGTPERS